MKIVNGTNGTSACHAISCTVGLACLHAWIYTPFLSGGLFYICFHLGFATALVVVATLYRLRPDGTPLRRAGMELGALLMVVGTLAIFTAAEPPTGVVVASALASGVGSAYCFARWFEAFCQAPAAQAVAYTLIGFSLSAVLRMGAVALYAVSSLACSLVMLALPCASAVLLRAARFYKPDQGLSDEHAAVPGDGAPNLAFVVFELAAFGLAFGVLRNSIAIWSLTTPSLVTNCLLRAVFPLLLLWWFAIQAKGERHSAIMRAVLLGLGFVLLAAIFLGGMAHTALSAIIEASRSFVSILIYLRLFEIVRVTKRNPLAVYGIGRAIYELAMVAGLGIHALVQICGLLGGPLPFTVLYFAVGCVVMLLLNSFSNALKLPILRTLGSENSTGAALQSTDDPCGEAAQAYSLSDREEDVLRLLCQGHTKKRIASVLGLSEDTVRYHSRNLYAKLGVHSKQELLDLVSGLREGRLRG
jgi:DNA-binding CsgD family transcriptional regulator